MQGHLYNMAGAIHPMCSILSTVVNETNKIHFSLPARRFTKNVCGVARMCVCMCVDMCYLKHQ